MRKHFAIAAIVAVLAGPGTREVATAEPQAGEVLALFGQCFIEIAGRRNALKPGDAVHVGDTPDVTAGAKLKLRMNDGSVIAVASGTRLAIADYRLLLIDQRCTGRSTPVGDIPGSTPQEQAGYLTHLRADGIVRDAELIRKELGVDRWSILGQSFGGFCSMTYLSFAPEGLREAFITGGLSPIGRPIDDIYAATWRRATQKNRITWIIWRKEITFPET